MYFASIKIMLLRCHAFFQGDGMTQMDVIFLGTSGAMPTKNRGLPSILFSFHKHFLFDIGEGTQRQLMRFNCPYGRIDAIFISHLHLDHYLGLFGILETYKLEYRTKPLIIYAPARLKKRLPEYQFVSFKPLSDGVIYEDEHILVSAFPVNHDTECFGFRIEEKARYIFDEKKAKEKGIYGHLFRDLLKYGVVNINDKNVCINEVARLRKGRKIVYSSDTRPCARLIKEAMDGDLLIHDAMYGHELVAEAKERGHSTAKQSADIAKKAKVKQLALFHISPRYKGKELEEEAKLIFRNSFVSEDGMRIRIEKRGDFFEHQSAVSQRVGFEPTSP